ncbi:MAG: tRNA (adenosine(37)-N6)-dimethylallyltransferase MiaA [Pseudomonadota bacterium]
MLSKANVILIAGATASGKSDHAMALAKQLNGVLINADSMQVYAELRVLTARPSKADEAEADHCLYGHVSASEAYSVGRWVRDATKAIGEALASGRPAIVVGGTGLYFKALLEGLSPIPEIPEEIRTRWRGEAVRLGAAALHDVLAGQDPMAADALEPNDLQRVVRALEVFEATERSIVDWQKQPARCGLDELGSEVLLECLLVQRARDDIYQRCDARFKAMIDGGALDEVAALKALELDPGLPVMRALGVVPLLRYLAGDVSRDEAIGLSQMETRRYVKRQLTWQRRNMTSWKVIES